MAILIKYAITAITTQPIPTFLYVRPIPESFVCFRPWIEHQKNEIPSARIVVNAAASSFQKGISIIFKAKRLGREDDGSEFQAYSDGCRRAYQHLVDRKSVV